MKLTQQFYHTLDEYTASNSQLKTFLTFVLDTLENGRIPSHSDITKVSSLSSLLQQYKQLYQIAQKISKCAGGKREGDDIDPLRG